MRKDEWVYVNAKWDEGHLHLYVKQRYPDTWGVVLFLLFFGESYRFGKLGNKAAKYVYGYNYRANK